MQCEALFWEKLCKKGTQGYPTMNANSLTQKFQNNAEFQLLRVTIDEERLDRSGLRLRRVARVKRN